MKAVRIMDDPSIEAYLMVTDTMYQMLAADAPVRFAARNEYGAFMTTPASKTSPFREVTAMKRGHSDGYMTVNLVSGTIYDIPHAVRVPVHGYATLDKLRKLKIKDDITDTPGEA